MIKKKQIEKAKKEIKEAEDATFEAANSCNCVGKGTLTRAVRDLEKAEAEVEEVDEM